ncbi:uncharacterized protein LOC143215117 isoform X2 [Lasioglossum baleicum]|uniref:uncharacterized protein LOC143215117 isoform X2 n=1 Tax=Lasioglossum baleicum TaxID=434251 RepID=UPI003FCC39BB
MQVHQKRVETETTIVALLVPHKGGCPLSHLCRDYHEMVGGEIPWRELGYASLMNFLESIPSNKSKHISKLVSGQKDQKHPVGRKVFKPSTYFPRTAPPKVYIPAETLNMIIGIVNEHRDGVSKDFVLQKVQDCISCRNITMSEMEEQLRRLSHKIYLSNNRIFPVSTHNSYKKMPVMTAAGEEDLINFSGYEDEDEFEFIPPTSMSTLAPTKSPAKAKSTSNFIKDSVSATQSQYKSNGMNNGVKEDSARSETNKTCLHTFYNENNNDAINNNNYTKEKEKYVGRRYAEDLINSRVKFRLEKLIQNNPDGIWCAELPEKYLEEYKLSLNYTELGFSSVREFASQLPDIFQCVQINNTGDFILYHSKRQLPSSSSKEKQNTSNLAKLHEVYLREDENEALPTTLTVSTSNQLIPEGIVTIGESVGQVSVTDLVSEEKPYIEVVVVEVFTPTFFWIQLRKKQKAFKTFMDDLHNFYVTKHQDYVIPPVILEKGLNCACKYNNMWHRGIIKTVKPDMQVTVMFYDYGTLKTYKPNEIYYLHRMFSTLPAQAIPCGLYNVRPYQATKWTLAATHQFAVRTSSIPLVATVEPHWINEMDNSMLITLTDTLEEEDVHINDWLVEQKLAEHGKMGDKVDMHNLLLYVEENLLFSPERCYEEEHNASNAVSNVSEETSNNFPLISPQSTFKDQNLKISSQPEELSGKSDKSTNLQDHIQVKNISFPQVTKPITSQDEPICNLKISTKDLLHLWSENLKLQTEISSIFEILVNKTMSNSETDDNLMGNENTLNTMSAMSNLNTYGNLLKTCSFNIKDVQNVGNLSRDLLNDNSNIHNYTNVPQNSLKDLNSLVAVVNDSNLDKASQTFPNKSASSRIPPGFEKVNLNLPNQFMNTVSIDLPGTFEKPVSFNIPLKETNPFKIDLINKLQKSQEENHLNSDDAFSSKKDQEPFVKHTVFKEDNTAILNTNLDDAKKFSANNPFGYQQYYSTCQLSTTDNTDTSPKFLSTDYPRPNVTSNTGIVENSISTMLCVNDLHSATNHLGTESENRFSFENHDAYKYTPSYLRIRSQEHEQKQEENVVLKHPPSTTTPCTDHALSYGNNCTTTSWLPINSFPSPVIAMQDSKNIDEGYLTGPSTLDRLSPLTQTIADADNYSASSKIWSTSATDKLAQSEKTCQTYLQSTKNENMSQLQNSKCHSVPIETSLDRKVYIKLLELPKRQVHIIHYQNEGWLLIEDFVLFTKLPNVAYMFDILRILDFPVPFVEIDRTQCSIECLESTSTYKQQTKDIMNGYNNLCLIQLKSALKLLKRLKVFSAQELNDLLSHDKFESGSIMHEIRIILCAYEQFKHCIKSRERL